MSELKNIVYHDGDEDRHLEIQFYPDALFFSIEFQIKAGMQAESFKLTRMEARELAWLILETIPDNSVLDANIDAI
jgi:hypothetical protein